MHNMGSAAETPSRAPNSVIRTFGGMGVVAPNGPVSIGGPRQRRLLALLTIRAGSVAEIDWLAEHLWNDETRPAAAAPALRTYVSRLRQALPDDVGEWLRTEPNGYRIEAPLEAVEHRHFAALRTAARQARDDGDPTRALGLLDRAIALWRGAPFIELEELDWARSEVEQLRMELLEAREERWAAALDLGRHTQITGELARFTSEHGLRERATSQHAIALHRSGRTAEALQAINRYRERLADETGLEVSSLIVDLERRLLDADPDLDVAVVHRPLRGYELMEEIGSGAFSTVWRAAQPAVGRDVAIKQIRHELAVQPDFIRRFEAEAHLVARLEHPRIVPLIDFWREPDSAYLVMRWLKGGTLERRLDDGSLSFDETLKLAQQIGEALAEAHRHGIVHRDLKTANILFDELGNAYLADFGIALEVSMSAGPEAARSPGSPAYSAPEQIRREPLGPTADVFSLGVVIFECLTGTLPFGGAASVSELIERQLHSRSPTLAELRVDVPAHVSRAVERATSKDPADRFDDVGSFLAALAGGAAHESSQRPMPTEQLSAMVENPYLGLRAFERAEADRFFGRRRLVEEMISRLDGTGLESRCIVLVGASGSGKSSAVKAGLLPALAGGAAPGSDEWFVTTMTPGASPFESLEAALLRVAVNPPSMLIDQLLDGERGVLRGVRRCVPSDDQRVLLVVDQLEEIYTAAPAGEAERFLAALALAAEDPATPLRVVVTLRADYYHRPLADPSFASTLSRCSVDVTPLAPDELEQAIVGPAAACGVSFEPGLAARVAAEALSEASPLPLMQYTLRELFDRRTDAGMTTEAYESLGALSGALAGRAERIVDTASVPQREVVRRVLGRLADPSQATVDVRRRVRIADLGDDPTTDWVLDEFGAARLFSFDRDPITREPTVEVAHEALFREWPRLAQWLEADREMLRQIGRLAAAADGWEHSHRDPGGLLRGTFLDDAESLMATQPGRLRSVDTDFVATSSALATQERDKERRRLARARRLTIAVAVFAVVACIGAAVALQQRNDAQAAADEAELATLISTARVVAAEEPDRAILLALEAHRRSPSRTTEQSVLAALGSGQSFRQVAAFDDPASPLDECPDIVFASSNGLSEHVNVADRLLRRDLTTGVATDFGPSPEPCGPWLVDDAGERRFSSALDAMTLRFGNGDGDWTVRTVERPTFLDKMTFTAAGHLIFHQLGEDDVSSLLVLDGTTGDTVFGPTSLGRDLLATGVSSDGQLVAASFGVPGRPEGEGLVAVFDIATGEMVAGVDAPLPASALAFSDDGSQLGIGWEGGVVSLVDVGSDDVVSTTELGTRSRTLDLAFRPDGDVLVVSQSQIEVIDAAGTAVTVADLRNAVGARVRDDGLVVVFSSDKESLVIDPASSALAERVWSIDAFAHTTFNDGRVGAITQPTGVPQVVDLATGISRRIELDTDGEGFFDAVVVYPEGEGLWALQAVDAAFGRWEEDTLVERVEIGGVVIAGERYEDEFAAIADRSGRLEVVLIDLTVGDAGIIREFQIPEAAMALPDGRGGIHVVTAQGRVATYDSNGVMEFTLDTGHRFDTNAAIAVDPNAGLLAVESFEEGVVIVDLHTGEVLPRPGIDDIQSLGFAQTGSLLVITNADGTVRLWDVERNVSAGLIWDGSGAASGSPPWFDESTSTVWFSTSGRVVEVSLDPERWVSRACELVTRELSQDEWDRFVPWGGEAQSACA